MLCLYILLFFPFAKLSSLYALFHYRDPFAIQGRKSWRRNIRICKICIQIIFFFSHGEIWEQHRLSTFIGIGKCSHQVDLAILELFHKLSPVAFYIFVIPACIGGNCLFVFITISASFTIFTGNMIGIRIPTYPDCFRFCICLRFRSSHRNRKYCKDHQQT